MTVIALPMDAVEPFCVERSAVCKTMLLTPSTGWPLWGVTGAGVVLMAVGFLADVRCLVLGLMICLAVAPCVAAFIFFSFTLAPGMVANLLPHTLERVPDGYVIRIWRRAGSDDAGEPEGEWEEAESFALADSDIVDRKTTCDYEMLYFKDSRMKILYVPRFKK